MFFEIFNLEIVKRLDLGEGDVDRKQHIISKVRQNPRRCSRYARKRLREFDQNPRKRLKSSEIEHEEDKLEAEIKVSQILWSVAFLFKSRIWRQKSTQLMGWRAPLLKQLDWNIVLTVSSSANRSWKQILSSQLRLEKCKLLNLYSRNPIYREIVRNLGFCWECT